MTKEKTKFINKTDTYNFKVISTGKELHLKCAKEDIRDKLDKLAGRVLEEFVCVIEYNDVYLNSLVVGKMKKETTLSESIKPKVENVFVSGIEVKTSFQKLNSVKCNVEKKGRFNYVSWTDCWLEVKKHDPNAMFKVYENEQGFPAWIKKDIGGFVKVGVTINDLEYIEHYQITDNYNKTILNPLVTDINNAIKRGMVKACAYHGLGLYVYRGEDLPEEEE